VKNQTLNYTTTTTVARKLTRAGRQVWWAVHHLCHVYDCGPTAQILESVPAKKYYQVVTTKSYWIQVC